jgi:arylsulfatase
MSEIGNLLLVSYDCARADVAYSGCLPTIERLRSQGVTCRRAITSAPLTPISHATVFTGLQPYHHGLRHLFREQISPHHRMLPEHLHQNGFRTAGIVSCPGLNRWYGFERGFQTFEDELPPLPDGGDALKTVDVQLRGLAMKRADVVADFGLRWLSTVQADDRWFLFLHFFDAHWPYGPPGGTAGAANPYEAELRYADRHFARVVDALDEGGLLDRTLVVVFGDHGEDLEGCYSNDKGGAERGHPEEKGHGCLLFEQTQHVPLIFAHPDIPAQTLPGLVGLIDVAPTICTLLGVPAMTRVDGTDLTPALYRRASVPTRTLYAETKYPSELAATTVQFGRVPELQALWPDERFKLIRSMGDSQSTQVFDLADDPNEQRPLPLSALPTGPLEWPTSD